jgi:hypothetical protein
MKKNVGAIDKLMRLLAALVVGVLYYAGIVSGMIASILGLVAVIFALTAFIRFCPIYAILGLSTCSKCNADDGQ